MVGKERNPPLGPPTVFQRQHDYHAIIPFLQPTIHDLQPQLRNHAHPVDIFNPFTVNGSSRTGIQPLPFPLPLQLRRPLVLALVDNLEQLSGSDAVPADTVDLQVPDEGQDLVALAFAAIGEAGHEEREDDELPLGVAVADDFPSQTEDLARGPRNLVDGVRWVVESLRGVHGCVRVDQECTIQCKGLEWGSAGNPNIKSGKDDGRAQICREPQRAEAGCSNRLLHWRAFERSKRAAVCLVEC